MLCSGSRPAGAAPGSVFMYLEHGAGGLNTGVSLRQLIVMKIFETRLFLILVELGFDIKLNLSPDPVQFSPLVIFG